MFVAGGATVVVAMLGLASILIRVRRQAVTDRFAPAIEAYVAAAVAGAVGMSIGVLLGAGRAGDRAVELRDVHLVLNVFGLIGLVIAGTLPFFAATQVRSKMSPPRHADRDARHVRRACRRHRGRRDRSPPRSLRRRRRRTGHLRAGTARDRDDAADLRTQAACGGQDPAWCNWPPGSPGGRP